MERKKTGFSVIGKTAPEKVAVASTDDKVSP